MKKATWRQYDIRVLAVAGSLLLSAYTMLWPHLPNDDAYTYVRTAEIFLQDGPAAAFDHYPWAAYSVLIAWVSLLGVNLFTAAYLLNALFFAVITWTFISVVRQFNASPAVPVFAALTILLFPEINEYRYMIIRDTGYWALSLAALQQFFLYAGTQRLLHGALFCLALLLGGALRPEAVVYLLLSPCILFFDKRRGTDYGHKAAFVLWGLAAAGLLLCLFGLILTGVNPAGLLSSFTRGYQSIITANFTPDAEQVNALVNALFGQHGAQYSGDMVVLFMIAGLLALLIGELVSGVGLPFSLLLIWGWAGRHIHVDKSQALPLIGFAAVNLVIALLFVFATHYLASRYVMLLCLTAVALVPGIVQNILQGTGGPGQRARAWIVLFFLFAAVDAYVSFGRSQQYLEDAALWVRENSNEEVSLLTNNRTVAYRSGMVEDYDRVDRMLSRERIMSLQRGDLLAVETSFDVEQMLSRPQVVARLGLETDFPEGDDVRIRIYRIIN